MICWQATEKHEIYDFWSKISLNKVNKVIAVNLIFDTNHSVNGSSPFYFYTILSIDLSIITMHVPLLTIICMFDCKLRCTLPLTAVK